MKTIRKDNSSVTDEMIMNRIYVIRGQKVMIDVDLAELYQLDSVQFSNEIQSHVNRFPDELIIELNDEDFNFLWRQNRELKSSICKKEIHIAFTERAIPMLSFILNSDMVLKVNSRVISIFNHLKHTLDNYPNVGLE